LHHEITPWFNKENLAWAKPQAMAEVFSSTYATQDLFFLLDIAKAGHA